MADLNMLEDIMDNDEDYKSTTEKKKKKKSKKPQDEPEDEDGGVQYSNGMLSCAGQDWTEVTRQVAERYGPKAKRVDLCYNELTTLKNCELFHKCEELVLDNNCLGDDMVLPAMPALHTLSLNKNRISDTEKLLVQVKACYPKLRFLSLLGNEACPNELMMKDEDDYKRYRYFVLFHLPDLKFLDSRPTSKFELEEAARVGQFMRVVKVSQEQMDEEQLKSHPAKEKANQFSPLPSEGRDVSTHRGTIGTCKYVYYGKHSEGNRFIRNNDL
eukprot:m.51970 g.51970  ORF g.51970 m.51970 type:complete len:271 (+) comp21526_c0_seq1:142-954(+)